MAEKKGVSSDLFKRNTSLLLLFLILILGFSLRVYHADYPVVGYHNWKEYHYLSEARNFAEDGFFANGFLLPKTDGFDLNLLNEGIHPDTFPTTSLVVGFLFNIFGISLFLARFVNILFVLGAVVYFYFLIKALFKREDVALAGALLLALNPLTIFFGRQVQLINPALFFMIGSFFHFIQWKKFDRGKDFYIFTLFAALSFITKYTFFVLFFPILALFPYKKFFGEVKKRSKQVIVALAFFIMILIWMMYNNNLKGEYVVKEALAGETINFAMAFSSELWIPLKSYIADNFTYLGIAFALLGVLFVIISKHKTLGRKFIMSYLLGGVVWFFIMSQRLSGHNYHQYPLVPLVLLLMMYAFAIISKFVVGLFNDYFKTDRKKNYLRFVTYLILFVLLIYPPVFGDRGGILDAKDRMFDTQFIGLDVAGNYIDKNAGETDRVFHSEHQSYGALWHADREGTGLPNDLELIKLGVNEYDFKWIFLYQWEFSRLQDSAFMEYVQNNFRIAQVGFYQVGEETSPTYILFEYGGTSNVQEMAAEIDPSTVMFKDYEYTKGTQRLSYFNLP